MEELLKKAQVLGIKDAGNFTEAQLTKAIEAAEKKAAARAELEADATELKVTFDAETADKDLKALVLAARKTAAEALAQEDHDKKIVIVEKFLGIKSLKKVSPDDLEALLSEKVSNIETTAEVLVEGKSDESYTCPKGKVYVFKEDAPAAFRYLKQHRTQKEWMADKDSMELMVAGNLSYLTQKIEKDEK